MFWNVSRTTPTTINKPEDVTNIVPELVEGKINPIKNGVTATKPKKNAPGKVIRRNTFVKYRWVGAPWVTPGILAPERLRFRA